MSDAKQPDFKTFAGGSLITARRPVFRPPSGQLVPVSTAMNTPLKAHASYQYPVGIVSVDQLVLSNPEYRPCRIRSWVRKIFPVPGGGTRLPPSPLPTLVR